ncbi:hypothetical protein AB0J82_21060 [Asanoa sp. NPDC049518]|uniref:hypothetical protein n=1 Tax=unclassified Asanoa TaxID=2685164 RepID=UPI003424D9C0
MLKPAWYLMDGDFLADTTPDPDDPDTEQIATVYAAAAGILGDEGFFDREHTMFAVRLGLLSATRLLDTATHGAAIHDKDDLAHLLRGMALLHAYLAQTAQRLADNARIIVAMGAPADPISRRVSDALATAGDGGEYVTSDLNRAYLALTGRSGGRS